MNFIWKFLVFITTMTTLYGKSSELRPIRTESIIAASLSQNYYKGRVEYLSKVIEIITAQTSKKGVTLHSVLELGAYKLPLVEGEDLMDCYKHLPNIKYLHDAKKTPWPIADKTYDLFIALQVWEHLGDQQENAFKEVMRISNMAILSFPYKWTGGDAIHNGIDDTIISKWTLGIKPIYKTIISNRAIYFFNFNVE